MSGQAQRPFAAVAESLAAFRAAVDGEPGSLVQTIGADAGDLPDLIRDMIGGLADVLLWLQRAAQEAVDIVAAGDAAVALFELGAAPIAALPGGIDLGPVAEGSGAADALAAINGGIALAGEALQVAAKLAGSVLPPAEDIAAIRAELDLLFGERTAPPRERNGSMTRLMMTIGL